MKRARNVTPLISPRRNLRVKLEHLGPGGSHKSRAARYIIERAITDGELTPGGSRRIIEKSGGNFGVGLAFEAAKHDIGVDLVIGLSFSPLKKSLCEEFGARLVGVNRLHEGIQPKDVISELLDAQGSEYFFTDQFANSANVQAHLEETGPEILAQIEGDVANFDGVSLVLGVGTGAHAAALGSVLSSCHTNFELVVVEPENCSFENEVFGDHAQQGAAVGVSPPFMDWTAINQVVTVLDREAFYGQRLIARETGFYPGPTSGANYFLASRMADERPERLIITMTYDAGEGYLSQQSKT